MAPKLVGTFWRHEHGPKTGRDILEKTAKPYTRPGRFRDYDNPLRLPSAEIPFTLTSSLWPSYCRSELS